MKCPFRIKERVVAECEYDEPAQQIKYREFDLCYGDECPFYYQDDDGVDKCSRCNPIIEEEM